MAIFRKDPHWDCFFPMVCELVSVFMTAVYAEGDGFALAMLGVILLSFGVLLMLGFCMFRAASKRDGEVDRLIEEVGEEEKAPVAPKSKGAHKREEWENDEDWWKCE